MNIDVWMALDPETLRVFMQKREFHDGDFPPGLRGLDWERRTGTINEAVYNDVLAANFTDEEMDIIHRDLWTDSGETPWPGYV